MTGYAVLHCGKVSLSSFQRQWQQQQVNLSKSVESSIGFWGHCSTIFPRLLSTTSSSSSSSSLYIRSVNSSEVIEGGNAVLRCEFERHNSLFAVAAWFRDDGRIFLPVEQLVDAVKRLVGESGSRSRSGGTGGGHESFVNFTSLRHFVLPTGDLLVSSVRLLDSRHRYRCQVAHQLTRYRHYASTWAYIRIKDKSELYHSGVRLNPALPSRHTVAVNEGDTAFFYCSFDGQPVPVIDWYHSDIRSLSRPSSSFSSNSSPYYSSSSQTYSSSPFSSYQVGGAGSYHRSWSWSSTGAHSEQPSNGGSSSSSSSSVYLYGRNFLAIERVTAEDTGIVTCIANSSGNGNVVRHEMLLFVKSSIQASLTATSSNPYPGQEITLSCNRSTNSAFPVSISAFGSPSVSSSSSSSSSSLSSSSSSSDPSSSSPADEQSARLRELISSHFLLNINWLHNGRPIGFSHRKRRSAEESLVIGDFREQEDCGFYLRRHK
ncbi:hypothetical protein TYRP_005466 [Tyrophagus putrescentiae]|nr:hypothetical protein TYRP_005466 [Tyrophagus putrescentiae]